MPNTAKQEAIRKAYGEYWERLPKKIKEEIFLLDGWLNWLSLNDISLGLLWLEIRNSLDVNIDSDKDRLRPKSLQGIETNNGWIRIESEEDLPKELIECWFIHYDKIYNGGYSRGMFASGAALAGWKAVTHYQPIVKPEKPIY